ncbi:MAG: hypothetical protein OXC07_12565, partial [Kistimonas sp.]|nr:hypothetical protein [Kistimonas sp.]
APEDPRTSIAPDTMEANESPELPAQAPPPPPPVTPEPAPPQQPETQRGEIDPYTGLRKTGDLEQLLAQDQAGREGSAARGADADGGRWEEPHWNEHLTTREAREIFKQSSRGYDAVTQTRAETISARDTGPAAPEDPRTSIAPDTMEANESPELPAQAPPPPPPVTPEPAPPHQPETQRGEIDPYTGLRKTGNLEQLLAQDQAGREGSAARGTDDDSGR